jgi:outer membrane murein-binding lipoprotein Lpp
MKRIIFAAVVSVLAMPGAMAQQPQPNTEELAAAIQSLRESRVAAEDQRDQAKTELILARQKIQALEKSSAPKK